MTDQDIAKFILSPIGFAALLGVAGFLFVAVVLDLALMSIMVQQGWPTIEQIFRMNIPYLATRLVRLFVFGILLLVRILAITAPFVLVLGLMLILLIGEYDINYYLTYWPSEFVIAVVVGAGIVLVLALVLAWMLSGWALALHLLLFEHTPPRKCFAQSAALIANDRMRIFTRVVGWAVVRFLLLSAVAMVMGLLTQQVQDAVLPDLRGVVIVTLLALALWGFANAVASGVANGALAFLLMQFYRLKNGENPPVAKPERQSAALDRHRGLGAILVVMVAFAIASVALLQEILASVAYPSTVEVIAHRGAAALRPENTLVAVDKALKDGADWVEIDVQETVDGVVVVAHDSDLMKLGNVSTKISDITLNDLREIDIGSWFDPKYSDQRTPTLKEVLELAQGRGRVLIELKYYGRDVSLEERVAQTVESTGMDQDVMTMSLKHEGIRKMKQIRPDWPAGVLAARAIGNLSRIKSDFVAVNTGQVSLRLIRQAHAAEKKIYVWTVDNSLTMSRMISMGVDGLITNNPALARHVIKERKALSSGERLVLWLCDRFRLDSLNLIADEKDA